MDLRVLDACYSRLRDYARLRNYARLGTEISNRPGKELQNSR